MKWTRRDEKRKPLKPEEKKTSRYTNEETPDSKRLKIHQSRYQQSACLNSNTIVDGNNRPAHSPTKTLIEKHLAQEKMCYIYEVIGHKGLMQDPVLLSTWLFHLQLLAWWIRALVGQVVSWLGQLNWVFHALNCWFELQVLVWSKQSWSHSMLHSFFNKVHLLEFWNCDYSDAHLVDSVKSCSKRPWLIEMKIELRLK